MRDPDGFMASFNEAWEAFDKEQEAERERKSKDFEKLITSPWLKQLQELAPRHQSTKLEDRIYKMLKDGENFTKEKADQFKDNIELLIKLKYAHAAYMEQTKDEWGDMFGEYLALENRFVTRGGQFVTPINVCDCMVRITMRPEDMDEPKSISDPCCGTGRFMLRTAKYYAEETGRLNFIFFNQDIDFKMYAYTAFNAILRDIPSYTVWGDTLAMEGREAILTIPYAPGFTPWHVIPKEKVWPMQSALLQSIEQSQRKYNIRIET